ncbi:MAG: hypothetical protein HYX94_04165 [Chloroflexi bacterium]|nr:hypothetical protein [Chloroflexota bacterium]
MRRKNLVMVSLGAVALVVVALVAIQVVFGRAFALGDSGPTLAQLGIDSGMDVTVSVSKPANGSFFTAGERPLVTITLEDKFGGDLARSDFATLGLYAYGPQETAKTVTAVKLLNATADRSKTPHHYIDLLTNENVSVSGNVLRYTFQPVSDEEPGTYTVSLRAVKKGTPPVNQAFVLVDFQLKTATAEKQIVEKEKCASCHLGASSGQFYFAHTDGSATNRYGSPALDSWPVRTCKSCHNNDGYSAYRGDVNDPAAPTTVRTPDPIVRRVHGVHMGEHLKNPFNTDPTTGDFRDYTSVLFPANVKNCTTCHVDDRWKTEPTRQACGACHDNIWFGDTAALPKAFKAHPGGPQANDSACSGCHPADTGGLEPISVAHKVSQPMNEIDITLSPPANGKFYTVGDKPVVTLVIKDDKGNPIDHTKVDTANFSTANLFVYGNRTNAVPVLTNAAKGPVNLRASVNSGAAPGTTTRGWTFAAGDTFKIAVNTAAPVTLQAPAGFQTPNQVRDWLASQLSGVTVTASATNVTIKSNVKGAKSRIDIYNSPVTTKMGWKPAGIKSAATGWVGSGVTQEPMSILARTSYSNVDLRKLSDPLDFADPNVTRSVGNITYQLDEVKGLPAGTYGIYSYVLPVAGKVPGLPKTGVGFMTFQVGTETEERKVATNCKDCHGNTIWHLDEGPIHAEPFDTDYCLACHDYGRTEIGDGFANQGGSSLNGWSGYGAVPIARRVHGVHRGAYLDHPEQIYANNADAFREIIFPQDIRNCEKCHDPRTTNAEWRQNPSRLACMACHDSDIANTHARLMTEYPNPADPWSADKVETCITCHGDGKEFSVATVHKITNPYVPPYPRE